MYGIISFGYKVQAKIGGANKKTDKKILRNTTQLLRIAQ